MTIRQEIEEREKQILSPYAALSSRTKGRQQPEKECDIRTAFQRDRDKIIHCKSFRRLKHKTQVFLSPIEDHYRTRLTHAIEVAQIARTISRALRLNEDLTEAIALGHDLGHTPFGHAGEEALDNILKEHGKRFFHNEQSVRVVETLENDGKGLNLCREVIDGIKNHTKKNPWPNTLEGCVVRFADRMAYLKHDADDAIRAKILTEEMLPKKPMKILGKKFLDRMVKDLIQNSLGKKKIAMSAAVQKAMDELYRFMYKNVYTDQIAKREETKVPEIIRLLFLKYHYDNEFQKGVEQKDQLQNTVDFLSGMTDHYAIKKFQELFVPAEWRTKR